MTLKFTIPEPFNKTFSVTVAVSKTGQFSCTLPADITALFTDRDMKLGRNRLGRDGYFVSDRFDGLNDAIEAAIAELCSEREISRERVIRYAISTACAYVIGDDGDFYPNGYTGSIKNSGWRHGTEVRHATDMGPFGLRIYALPVDKVTYEFTASGTTRHEYVSLREHLYEHDQGDLLQYLCGICGLSEKSDCFGADGLDIKEVPCTPETLRFFVGLFKSLFALNEKITPFLEPEGIMQLANNGVALLGGPSAKEGEEE